MLYITKKLDFVCQPFLTQLTSVSLRNSYSKIWDLSWTWRKKIYISVCWMHLGLLHTSFTNYTSSNTGCFKTKIFIRWWNVFLIQRCTVWAIQLLLLKALYVTLNLLTQQCNSEYKRRSCLVFAWLEKVYTLKEKCTYKGGQRNFSEFVRSTESVWC